MQLNSRLDVGRLIGEGAHGTVHEVTETHPPYAKRAMKRIPINTYELNVEASLLQSLCHPNIVKVYEVSCDAEATTLIMELAEQGDLKQHVQKSYQTQPIPEALVRNWLCQICLGLHYLHEELRILHRDIKTSNILVTAAGLVKLSDFGIAKKLDWNADDYTGTMVGTPCCLSPEVINFAKWNSKSDVWGLGCLLYELCCGSTPFKAGSIGKVISRILKDEPSEIPPHYSDWLRTTVSRTLEKSADKRISLSEILSSDEMRRQMTQLRTRFPDYKGHVFPELALRTTRFQLAQDKLKAFAQQLKTTKNDRFSKNLTSVGTERNQTTEKYQQFCDKPALIETSQIAHSGDRVNASNSRSSTKYAPQNNTEKAKAPVKQKSRLVTLRDFIDQLKRRTD